MRGGTSFLHRGGRLDTDRSVRVVVGEAGGSNRASIRSTLEREGFHIMGYAASDVGLEAVLASVRPEAIVLDAHIGVRSVLAAKQLAPSAKIVVVWPAGVSAAMADERVEPSRVSAELANVVRRAVGTPHDVTPVIYRPAAPQPRPVLSSSWERSRKPRRRVAALTVAATLALGAAAFAIGAPHWEHRGDASDRQISGTHRRVGSTTSPRGHGGADAGGGGGGSGGALSTPQGCSNADAPHDNGTPPEKGDAHDNGRHLGNGPHGPCDHPTGRPSGAGKPNNPQGGPGHGQGQGGGHGQGQGAGHGQDPHGGPSVNPSPSEHPGPQHSLSLRTET